MAPDELVVGQFVERKSKNDTVRSASKYGTIVWLTHTYAFIEWNTGMKTRVQRAALKPYQPPTGQEHRGES